MAEKIIFFGCYCVLAGVILLSSVIILPTLVQILTYTVPIVYIGSHLSLKMREVSPETGEKTQQVETFCHKDAMLFPLIGSAALLSLYLAYKFLPSYWVNLLLTLYLGIIGVVSLAETIVICLDKLLPSSSQELLLDMKLMVPKLFKSSQETIHIKSTLSQAISFGLSVVAALYWIKSKSWMLHNLLAIAFGVQAIRLISVGSFKIASVLLGGLFAYDIFWVFGTNVMVVVAKSIEAPAKFIMPRSFDPWQQSVLGLGDVVIPGIFVAMTLRFDCWRQQKLSSDATSKKLDTAPAVVPHNVNVNIHERFYKKYFTINLVAYSMGLINTTLVMIAFKAPQPALLYIVPCCLLGLYAPALFFGDLQHVLNYSEESEEKNAAPSESPNQPTGEDLSHVSETTATKRAVAETTLSNCD